VSTRAFHYHRAEELAEEAVQKMASADRCAGAQRAARDDAHMLLRAALIHATLATAGPGVADDEKPRIATTWPNRQEPEGPLPPIVLSPTEPDGSERPPPPPPPYEPTGLFHPKPGPPTKERP
jgi:hypothetical protein